MPATPDAVRLLAEFPITYGPEPPAEMPVERVRTSRFSALLMPGPWGQLIEALDLGEDVPGAVEEVRALLRGSGRDRAVWFVAPASRPERVLERLRACGLEPAVDPPWEPQFAAMVLGEAPEPGPTGIIARAVESLDEFERALRLEDEVFEVPEDDRRAREKHRHTLWELQESGGSSMCIYVALLDGRMVGVARSLFADAAVNLSGGSVLPDARSRGVYRALVRARWDEGVARGTPALTVQAGRMSRPVLERLGFATVAEQHCLIDRFASG